MLAADLDLQVWLDTIPDSQPVTMVAYVESPQVQELSYRLTTSKQGPAGSARLSQGGRVNVPAGQPTVLTQFSMTLGEHDACTIRLVLLTLPGAPVGTYHFNCNETDEPGGRRQYPKDPS
ncbi:MAG TPA: curli-like amyloid fiber formation chaperone CsgH [Burkholderiaceae bacterium]|nr:curli-like amyloid fiber formation chaperone CsgH [Burkholderiaceae bacterium]